MFIVSNNILHCKVVCYDVEGSERTSEESTKWVYADLGRYLPLSQGGVVGR
jgi:hypothetical protein